MQELTPYECSHPNRRRPLQFLRTPPRLLQRRFCGGGTLCSGSSCTGRRPGPAAVGSSPPAESVTLGASCDVDAMSSGMIMTVAGGPCPLVGEAAAQEPLVAPVPVVMGTGDRSSGVGATESYRNRNKSDY